MSCYEKFKNELTMRLTTECPDLSLGQMNAVLSIVDETAKSYDFSEASTALIVQEDGVPELVQIYIASKKVEGLAEGTLENKLRTLIDFCHTTNKPLTSVTANDIRVYLYNYQQSHGISNRTLDALRIIIRSFFGWLAAEGYLSSDPALTVRAIKYEKKQRQSLSQIELEYVRKACRDSRDRAIIEFLYSTGCRVSELVGCKISDVDFMAATVHLFGKGSKHRTSYLNAKASLSLHDYLKSRNDNSEFLFVSQKQPHEQLSVAQVQRIVKRIRKDSGITKPLSPHILRHTTATQAVAHGMPVEAVRQLLGHESVATTMIYVETAQEDVQSSYKKAVV